LGSSDLELVTDATVQTVGLRFNGVTIPQGATITNAYLQFKTDEAENSVTSLLIQGQKSGNAATFTTANANVSSRPRTTAGVSWNPVAWATVGQAGLNQRTPDIQAVIQEIVNQAGWSSGNSLAIIITGTGTRTAETFEGDSAGAPLLHVEYTLIPNNPPVVTPTTFSLNENSPNGSVVGTVSASDPDGHNITYSLTGGNTGNAFAIHPTTGVITVNNAAAVDFEATPQFQLTVTATDNGPGARTGSATVTVNLGDLDEAPVVQPGTFNVLQGSANGTVVGTVTASQIDAGQSVSFSITAGNTNNVFAINASTGQITVANVGQLGGPGTAHVLTVQATDNTAALLSGSATVTINVTSASQTLEVRVNAGSDDAEQAASGTVDLGSSDLELVPDVYDRQRQRLESPPHHGRRVVESGGLDNSRPGRTQPADTRPYCRDSGDRGSGGLVERQFAGDHHHGDRHAHGRDVRGRSSRRAAVARRIHADPQHSAGGHRQHGQHERRCRFQLQCEQLPLQ
jgi:hypothetical protein